MTDLCEFEFVPKEGAVRDSMAQMGNHNSKFEALILERDSIECWKKENFFHGSLGSNASNETKRCTQEQVRGEDLSIKKGKNCANVGTYNHGSHTQLQDER